MEKKMKTYPYISTEMNNLLLYAKDTAMLIGDESNFFSHGFKITIDESKLENNTREYLANTYGEVVSPEHAEFIAELAENTGFGVSGLTSRSMCFEFSGDCNVVFYEIPVDIFANNEESKKITIPLPPKAEPKIYPQENLGEAPKHFDCVCNKCGGKCCTGQCDKQESSEWPQIGDEVMFTDLLQHYDQYRGGYCNKASKVIARFNTTEGEFITVHREYCAVMTVRVDRVLQDGALIKPKTPEEELRDDLKFDIGYLLAAYEKPSIITEKLLEKYDIKKKPQ